MKRAIQIVSLLVFILVPALVSYGAVALKDAVGVWLLDEGSGTVAKDSSGNNNEGKIEVAKWTDGKIGKALLFDGDGSVTVQSTDKLNMGSQFTMMAYFNARALNDWHVIIAKNNQYLLRIDNPAEGNKMSSFINLNGAWEPRASAVVPELNKWIHYAAVYDSGIKKLRVYVNGALGGESDRDGKPTPNTDPVTFGHWNNGSIFNGTIDDVAIFSVALSESDIKSIADKGLASALSLGGGGVTSVTPGSKLAATWGDVKQP